jgi:hypothetical protein
MTLARVSAALVRVVAVACLTCQVGCSGARSDSGTVPAQPSLQEVSLSQDADTVTCYDFIELALKTSRPSAANPFTDVLVSGEFELVDRPERLTVEGFADAADGSLFHVRFMPSVPGTYAYSVTYWQANHEQVFSGRFTAVAGTRRGLVAVDPAYPWHFIWTGTAEHYFLNGTTAFLLMGWDDERVIRSAIDRFASLSVNRIRVLLDGRTDHFWSEPIAPGNGFQITLHPWEAKHPDDIWRPEFDYSRFDLAYWRKFERMLAYARARNIVVSVIFQWNDTNVHPIAGSEDERRYLRYAIARLSAYSNVTWDLGDDLDMFRSDTWTHETGAYLHDLDPYHHLATSHPVHNEHQDRTAAWFGMTSFQRWDRPLHDWMLSQRAQQIKSRRIIPQVNEEYGYEDHYPDGAPYGPPAASADANRRAAWEMSMAGGYQTAGETAKRGTGVAPDTGGGWVNGRGDDTMAMLKGTAHMLQFFTSFEWWKTEPHDELASSGTFCLADPGKVYVAYLPHGGRATLTLETGHYHARWFDPRRGEYTDASDVEGLRWTSPARADGEDWALLLERDRVE